jgi:hypothetical protein
MAVRGEFHLVKIILSCACACLFITQPVMADALSSMTALSGYSTNIKSNAERGDFKMAERYAVAGLQLVSKNPSAYEPSFVRLYIETPTKELISSLRRFGKYDRADYITNWLYDCISKVHGNNSIELMDPLSEFATTLSFQKKYGEAEARYKQALAIADKAPFVDTLGKLKIMSVSIAYSELLKKLGREKDAELCLQRIQRFQ